MAQRGFAFVGTRCTGCKTCMLACMDYYDLDDIRFRTVYEFGGGGCMLDSSGRLATDAFAYYVSIACNHCDKPACAHVCPTTAMHKDPETGLVTVDADKCIGCGYCEMACPYGNPSVDRVAGHSVKCTGCASRVAEGKAPLCVESCPMRALEFGDIDELRSRYGSNASLAPLPVPDHTDPNIVVVNPAGAVASDGDKGAVLNVKEVI